MKVITLSWMPQSGHKGHVADVYEDGTVVGNSDIAHDLVSRSMDMTLPPDERLLRFVGPMSFIRIDGPTDVLEKGDRPGHPFHGNQYTGGLGGGMSQVSTIGRLGDYSPAQQDAIRREFKRTTGSTIEECADRLVSLIDSDTSDARYMGVGWYDRASQQIDHLADQLHLDHVTAYAMVSAMSPRTAWDYKGNKKQPNLDNMRATVEVLRELAGPGIKVSAYMVKKMHLTHTKPGHYGLTEINESDLGKMLMAKIHAKSKSPVLPMNITNAARIYLHPDRISDGLGGPKVRAFFNGFLTRGKTDSVTIDAWMQKVIIGVRHPPKMDRGANPGTGKGAKAEREAGGYVSRIGEHGEGGVVATYPAYEEAVHLAYDRIKDRPGNRGLTLTDMQAWLWYIGRNDRKVQATWR